MVTAPKPPGSRQLISPPAAVLEMAPAKVLQGAVRLQGLASSPTPETQVRDAWANAGVACRPARPKATAPNIPMRLPIDVIITSLYEKRTLSLKRAGR